MLSSSSSSGNGGGSVGIGDNVSCCMSGIQSLFILLNRFCLQTAFIYTTQLHTL